MKSFFTFATVKLSLFLTMKNCQNFFCFVTLCAFLLFSNTHGVPVNEYTNNSLTLVSKAKNSFEGDFKVNRTLILSNNQRMPVLGLGTWQILEEDMETALDAALEAGYRYIDCAPLYKNEKAVGKTLKKWIESGKVKREELFILSKLPPPGIRPSGVEKWLKKSLRDLQLNFLDMYLIQTPFAIEETDGKLTPTNKNGELKLDMRTDLVGVWKETEKQVVAGRTRAIGLSNFNIPQIERILNIAQIPVSDVQIELHVYYQQNELVEFCKTQGIPVTAYSPLGSRATVKLLGKEKILPDMMKDPVVQEIAKKHNKTPAQILLRHILQKGVAVIPKSTHPNRIRENIDVFDFELDLKEIYRLSNLNKESKGAVFASFFEEIKKRLE